MDLIVWKAENLDGRWYAVSPQGVHPIPFESERDANRAVARLNARDNA